MQLAMIGLGRMGGNMVRRLLQGGHELVVYDRKPEAAADLLPLMREKLRQYGLEHLSL